MVSTKTLVLDVRGVDLQPAKGTKLRVTFDRKVNVVGGGTTPEGVTTQNANVRIPASGTYPQLTVIPADDPGLAAWSQGYSITVTAQGGPAGGVTGSWKIQVLSGDPSPTYLSSYSGTTAPLPAVVGDLAGFTAAWLAIQNGAVPGAAAAAVAAAIANAGLVKSSDPRLWLAGDTEETGGPAGGIIDANNRVVFPFAVTDDGRPWLARPQIGDIPLDSAPETEEGVRFAQSMSANGRVGWSTETADGIFLDDNLRALVARVIAIGGAFPLSSEINQTVNPATEEGVRFATTVSAGMRADWAAVTEDGVFLDDNIRALMARAATLGAIPTSGATLTKLYGYGDSMTQNDAAAPNTWLKQLETALGITTQNYGGNGQRSSEIALRSGGLPVFLTLPGNTIPADTSDVSVTTLRTNDYTAADINYAAGTMMYAYGTLGGVPVQLRRNGTTGGSFILNRVTAGSAVTIYPDCPFISATAPTNDCAITISAGRNNPTNKTAILRDVLAMSQLRPNNYLVLSVINTSTEPSGSTDYNTIIDVNNALAAAHGRRFFDMRGWLIRNGLAAVGLTPTTQDTTDISNDVVPASLRVDTIHMNAYGSQAWAIALARYIPQIKLLVA